MTSRLKRKLNDLGVDTSSSKSTENFCLIGTPLPPLEKSKDTGEFVPLWKQEVRDEKGRRRLHGAFTGGFSAGYFNTVGSKEGWTPSEFRSSRVDRAKKEARPEDFMDEEDLRELRDNQKLVDTTEEMDLDFWERKATGNGEEKDSIANALAAALLPAPRDSVGAQILKKMGWRIGHGIGPKVTYEQRKRQDALFHGLTGFEGALSKPEDHEEATKHLYPPRDTKAPVFKRKDDKHGLGYESGPGLSQLVATEMSAKDRSTSGQSSKISAGFGLGALNDADEDDLDVYDGGPNQTSRRLAYDADEDDEKTMMRKTTRPSSHAPSSTSKSYFSNGLPCLPGFVVANKPVSEENLFHPPVVPKDWAPDPRRVWEQDKENFRADSDTQGVARQMSPKDGHAWRRSELSANQRGNILGEAPLPAAPRSVFDYLKPKDRERLKSLSTGHAQKDASIPPEDSQRDPGPTISERAPSIPPLDPQVAKMALQGFQPFTNDPIKQTRYTAYLQAQAAGEDSVPFSRMPGQAADAFMRELEDYARSARLFKPVSGAMAGRFTRAAVMDTSAQTAGGLHHPAEEGSYLSMPGESEKEAEPEKEESPKENAARLGMYGPLTREVKTWVPARLLCKRFGVKEPEVELPSEAEASGAASGKVNWQRGGVLSIAEATGAGFTGSTRIGENGAENENGPAESSSTPGRRDVANIGLGDEDETQGQDILTYERPGMDIFKAIFASDEEDADQGEDAGDADSVGHKSDAPSQTDESVAPVPGSKITKSDAKPSHVAPVDYNNMAGKVDISEFKPTFVSRSDRAKVKEKDKRDKGKDREKEKKKKKHRTALVSFEVEEESGDREQARERDSEKKRKKKKSERKKDISRSDDADDEGMWIEKPPPETVQNLVSTAHSAATEELIEAGPPRGRKRAVDFL
ncbi:hypothetical protein A7U60_g2831 [Sanghuangporus baumii]|uniref:G-patch domain-containing protein n=1 Tax=Sanghuangporus baumii TaxID=108892 RepID=A0A9Q5I1T1_SANBA|nr:hypothetical protein A7U60_g2831 [Sanghuangporus baumii]